MQPHGQPTRLPHRPGSPELTPERIADLRRKFGIVMDHLVLRTRPDADSAVVTAHTVRILSSFLTCAAALGVVVPDREDGAYPADVQEVWAEADRCLVEAYSRALCANSSAARDALADACRTAFRLETALRDELGDEAALCTSR